MAVQRERVDVLVIGGGPAGLAAAIGLRRTAGLRVLVAEAGGAPRERFGETLAPDVVVALERLGVLADFRAGGHEPCPGSTSLWGTPLPGHNDFILNPLGPGWHIHRTRFVGMLRAAAIAAGAVLRTRTAAVAAARAPDGGFDVALRDAGTVRARWVVDASGPAAWFARRQGARRAVHDRLAAIVGLASIAAGSFTARTLVEAAPYGWWYCARVPDERLVTILVVEPRAARELAARRGELLATTALLAPRLAAVELEGERLRTGAMTSARLDRDAGKRSPSSAATSALLDGVAGERLRTCAVPSARLDRVAGERWLAVGDAAATLDPIASRGVYDALAGAADAVSTIAAAFGVAPPPPWRYEERVTARFDDYTVTRAALYARERRFGGAPFWRARSTPRSPAAARAAAPAAAAPTSSTRRAAS